MQTFTSTKRKTKKKKEKHKVTKIITDILTEHFNPAECLNPLSYVLLVLFPALFFKYLHMFTQVSRCH